MNIQLAQLMRAMINYDSGDAPRIQHFVKVHNFAATIGVAEHLDEETQFILESAAILHDIGIHPAEAKYGNCNGKAQEELGPSEAHKLLATVKHALFYEDDEKEAIIKALKKYKPESILILGTSDGMVQKIAANLGLPEV